MSLIYRIKRLVKSDLHAFVEGMEEKKWILAQAIRDMEEELERMGKEIEMKKVASTRVKESIRGAEATLSRTETDIEFSMQEKLEDIAKTLIRKLILTQKNLERFRKEEEVLTQDLHKADLDFQAKRRSYEEICTRAETLHLERLGEDVFQSASNLVPEEGSLKSQVELEFLRRLQKVKEARHEN